MTAPVLYLDFDGVLHAADARVPKDGLRLPQEYDREIPSEQPLFRYAALLELLLRPHPELPIVLSTALVPNFGFEFALRQLPRSVQERVIGAMTVHGKSRFECINIDARDRGIVRWLALDEDLDGWPVEQRHLVVAPTNALLALAQPGVAYELSQMLNALCAGLPLEQQPTVAVVPSMIDRLRALPGISENEILDALEEDARVGEILRQARARLPTR